MDGGDGTADEAGCRILPGLVAFSRAVERGRPGGVWDGTAGRGWRGAGRHGQSGRTGPAEADEVRRRGMARCGLVRPGLSAWAGENRRGGSVGEGMSGRAGERRAGASDRDGSELGGIGASGRRGPGRLRPTRHVGRGSAGRVTHRRDTARRGGRARKGMVRRAGREEAWQGTVSSGAGRGLAGRGLSARQGEEGCGLSTRDWLVGEAWLVLARLGLGQSRDVESQISFPAPR